MAILSKLRQNKIALRYLLIVGSVLVIGQLAFAIFVLYSNFQQQRDDLHQKAVSQAKFLSSVIPDDVLANSFYPMETLMRQTAEEADFIYSIVVHLDGRVLTNFINNEDPYVKQAMEEVEIPRVINVVDHLAQKPNIIEVSSPVISEGLLLGEVRLGYTAENVIGRLRSSIITILAFSAMTGTFLVLLTMQQFRVQIHRPINQLNNAAKAFAQGDLEARSPVGGENEINQLQQTFNNMAGRLQDNLLEMEKLSNVASRTNNMVVICDPSGHVEWVNDAFIRVTGYTLEEVVGKKPGHILQGPNSDPVAIDYMRRNVSSGKGFTCEIINYSKSGESYWVSVEAQPVYDDQNQLINYIAIETDITEKKKASEQLKSYAEELTQSNIELYLQESRLRSLLKIATSHNIESGNELKIAVEQGAATLDMPIGILSKVEESVIEIVEIHEPGRGLASGLTCALESSLCQSVIESNNVVSSVNFEDFLGDMPNWMASFEPRAYIGTPVYVDGKIFGTLSFLTDDKRAEFSDSETDFVNLLAQWIGATLDRQLSRNSLVSYAKDLERSNKELADFAHIASHDLQEPLRKIQTFGSRLESKYASSLEGRGVDYLQRMQNAANRMQILVQELLSYSSVTTRAKPFEETNLQQILDEVLLDLEVRVEQVDALIDIRPLATIDADAIQVRQLFQNFIGNALKFTVPDRRPHIIIEGTHFVSENNEEMYEIRIADNGIGFDEKFEKKIFGIFQQLHAQDGYEGTGVGLAICKKIIDRHSGQIIVQSKPNVGTTFMIQLPVIQEKPDRIIGESHENISDAKISTLG